MEKNKQKLLAILDIIKETDPAHSMYVQSTLGNFHGEKIMLELVTDASMLNDILDCFGNDIRVKACGEKIAVTVRTTESEGLYRRLMEYAQSIKATAPASVVDEITRRLKSAIENYSISF